MSNSSPPTNFGPTLEGIEVVELSEVDLDFAVEEVFGRKAARPTLDVDTTRAETATPDELSTLDLFRGLEGKQLDALAPLCQSIHAVPGYVLLAPGRINSKVFFVIEGQLRLYARTGDKRPIAIADVGHSTGLRSALLGQPANHAVIATEASHLLAMELATLDEAAKRTHALARNYAALLASYLRGDNCLNVSGRAPGAATRPSHVDELTLLHNQHWLDTVFPRLVARCRLAHKHLAVTAFAIDGIEQVIKAHGIGTGLRVLQAVGHWVLDQTRPTDLLAVDKNRYIFAFLPDCDVNAARDLARRLREQIKTLSIPLGSGNAPPVTVTLSIAAAELEQGMKDGEFLAKTETLIRKSINLGGNQLSEAL